ncbi:MAG: winged helix-turn-helix transcriptional regulator [Nitrososphaerota archaeon]|nr:winged helix-turn-helix transcriptional regulator [Nitrososphaerota archaeon]MDG7009200.1 winged helix-turn-helix transcriptional regulator [Nitrososphaerota archaeon]MDG7018951.1 winged helix-turn-helix transcriptional regulator [Nitrososphaerota archaeon]
MALGDGFSIGGPFRLRLLYHLVVRPRTPTELASLENKHLSDISRGLSLLRRDGLVRYESTGARERYYKLTQEGYVLLYASLRQGR